MIVSLKIPDELYEAYGRKNPEDPRAAMAETLAAFAASDPAARTVSLAGEDLKTAQSMLGQPFDTSEKFLELLRKALCVRFENVEVALTPAQRKSAETSISFFKIKDADEFLRQKLAEGIKVVFGV